MSSQAEPGGYLNEIMALVAGNDRHQMLGKLLTPLAHIYCQDSLTHKFTFETPA